jgi:5,5'-dehydrodivanillate O-demethylase
MLTLEQNDRYTRVGPGTPCGELMRRYWHPIAAVSQMKSRNTMPIRLLGEDLVLYKDRSGTFGLIEPRCPHRRMSLLYGVPQQRGLRCAYHGWVWDETGKCLEQPYEETEDPEGRFKEKVRARAYPVQVLAGLVFAYLGPEPAPLLPRWDVYAATGVVRDIGYQVLPCNWLQCQENSLDPVHLEWLHEDFANWVREQIGRTDLKRKKTVHDKIGFDVFEYGIVKRRVYKGGSEEDTAWKDGHPIVFPNMLRQGGSGLEQKSWRALGPAFQVRVPIDDTHTGHWWVACYEKAPEDPEQKDEDVPFFQPPLPTLDETGTPQWGILDSNSAQDVAAWMTQGGIADRTAENLGRSDKGIILFRRMLEDNIRMVEDGGDPVCVIRDPAKNVYIPFQTERHQYGNTAPRQGAATKYSPILTARGVANTLTPVDQTPANMRAPGRELR